MFYVVTVETERIKKRRGGLFEGYPVLEPVAFRLARIPIEHYLCIYNMTGVAQLRLVAEQGRQWSVALSPYVDISEPAPSVGGWWVTLALGDRVNS